MGMSLVGRVSRVLGLGLIQRNENTTTSGRINMSSNRISGNDKDLTQQAKADAKEKRKAKNKKDQGKKGITV